MRISKFFIISSLALSVWSCKDDKGSDTPVVPTPGQEVKFGVTLDAKTSRTIYGEETDNRFPIYWVNNDQVTLMSPECDIKTATYKVNVKNESQNYADALEKVGDAGIQWGNTNANFYSIYPAGRVQATDAANRKITVRMGHMQNDYINSNGLAKPDMNDAFMYAQTFEAQNGATVNLAYKPLATAIRFKLHGPSTATGTGSVEQSVIISHITLEATDVALAGNFNVEFPENEGATPTISVGAIDNEDVYNRVTVYSSYEGSTGGGYLTLNAGEEIELNAFVIPQSDVTIDDNWTLTVTLSSGITFMKKLGGTSLDGKTMTLEPGQIHRLPDLPALNIPTNTEYDPANWMVNIPRNTYLSEISIPGSWNSMNSSFQNTTDLATQYAAGVRAFHIDTRWKVASNPTLGYFTSNRQPNINGLGIADGSGTWPVHSGSTALSSTVGRVMRADNKTFASALGTITEQVKGDEYMIVFCTFAQGSFINPAQEWYNAVSEACASNDKIYDASTINENTVVGDVLGKVIVIVNCEGQTPVIQGSKCFFVDAPLTLTADNFASATGIYSPLYWGSSNTVGSGVSLFETQAQVTATGSTGYTISSRGYAPTLSQRQAVGNSILEWSKNNYGNVNYTHSDWIYLGLGGYQQAQGEDDATKGSYATVANSLNPWINSKVTNMSSRPTGSQTNYYPVGLVLMNFVTDENGNGIDAVNNILQLNNKYQKEYNPDWTGTVDSQNEVRSASPSHSSGFKVSSTGNGWQVF